MSEISKYGFRSPGYSEKADIPRFFRENISAAESVLEQIERTAPFDFTSIALLRVSGTPFFGLPSEGITFYLDNRSVCNEHGEETYHAEDFTRLNRSDEVGWVFDKRIKAEHVYEVRVVSDPVIDPPDNENGSVEVVREIVPDISGEILSLKSAMGDVAAALREINGGEEI